MLSIAFCPLIAPNFWHKYEISIFVLFLLASSLSFSFVTDQAFGVMRSVVFDEYIPFILTLLVLYVLSQGIHVEVKVHPSTVANLIFLGCGSVFASLIGTTGSSMLLLRPFLEMNKTRKHKAYLVVFFIFLVSNIGGLLTPLGDPPLLIGYLKGVDFLWELKHLFPHWAIYVGLCLSILYFVDRNAMRIDPEKQIASGVNKPKILHISGKVDMFLLFITLLLLYIDTIAASMRCLVLSLICAYSMYNGKCLKRSVDLSPFREVAITFFVIFIAMAPVLFVLNTNSNAIHESIAKWSSKGGMSESVVYFVLCSLVSSFLDNAPSYLLFFNMAGGDAQTLMTTSSEILKAISVSSVVMGSMTYIGNAPNLMVRAIAKREGIEMPSFIGYMLWSSMVILPISVFILLIFH
jgi:Na+/H+ antiporter NhaD/arsenite permease-like protein